MESDIRAKVRGFLAETSDNTILETLGDDTSMMRVGLVDSAGMLALASFLEQTFSITISDEEFDPDNLDSLSAIERFVERKRAG